MSKRGQGSSEKAQQGGGELEEASAQDTLPVRTPVHDAEATTTLQIRTLNVELTCPVCLGILHQTMTVMQCLHRFCAGCISKALRLGKKECPTCRGKCSSTRHLRPDPNIDGIIAAIYPNLDEYEAREEATIAEINQRVMRQNQLLDSVEQGKRRQALAKHVRPPPSTKPYPSSSGGASSYSAAAAGGGSSAAAVQAARKKQQQQQQQQDRKRDRDESPVTGGGGSSSKKAKAAAAGSSAASSAASAAIDPTTAMYQAAAAAAAAAAGTPEAARAAALIGNQGPEISFVLVPHQSETLVPALQNRYLRTSRMITVRHLCKFLAKKLNVNVGGAGSGASADQQPSPPPPPLQGQFRISTSSKPFQPLPDDYTLDRIDREIWKKPSQELTLFYRLELPPGEETSAAAKLAAAAAAAAAAGDNAGAPSASTAAVKEEHSSQPQPSSVQSAAAAAAPAPSAPPAAGTNYSQPVAAAAAAAGAAT